MATATIQDYRRTDLRTNVLENPYWITSGWILGADAPDDKACVLFSFPTAGLLTFIEQVVIEVVTAFTAGTTMDLGQYTLATDAITTGGVATLVDVDDFMESADVTMTTAAYYQAAAAGGNDWLTAKIAAVPTNPYMITGAATTVICVAGTPANAGTIAAGKARVHMLICNVPGK